MGRVRTANEDTCGAFELSINGQTTPEWLFIVADGMGGHVGGAEASRLAVEALHETFCQGHGWSVGERLRRAFEAANQRVYEHAHAGPTVRKMGTTCTALALADGFIHLGHIGDSRAYRLDGAGLFQLTHDHTVAAMWQRQGVLTAEEAETHPRRHTLTRALGVLPRVEIDLAGAQAVEPPLAFVLCSDGLAAVTDAELDEAVRTRMPQDACDYLVDLANERGGPDNISVIVARLR